VQVINNANEGSKRQRTANYVLKMEIAFSIFFGKLICGNLCNSKRMKVNMFDPLET
jgi:hypothetical protein